MFVLPRETVGEFGASPTQRALIDAPGGKADEITRLFVLATVVVAGLDIRLIGAVPLAVIVVGATTPLWWQPVMGFEFARTLCALGFAAIPAGLYLAERSSEHHAISRLAQLQTVMLLLGGFAVLVAVLWGRSHFPLYTVAVAYGAGNLTNAMLLTSRSWKFHLALPVTILLVGWLGKYRHQLPAIVAILALGVLTALDRGRSFFAFCLLAACLLAWQRLPVSEDSRTRRWTPAVVLTVAGAATYDLAIRLLALGYLGSAAQERTVTQAETSGSLLLGGRPSALAAIDLIREHPWGYGLGVVPNTQDYAVVTSSFQSLNLFEHGYIMRYILDGQFRLHSIAGDLWISYGVIGLALAATMLLALVRTVSTLIAQRRCPPVVAVMAIVSMWYILFEPAYSYGNDVFFALGIALLPGVHDVRPDRSTRGSREAT